MFNALVLLAVLAALTFIVWSLCHASTSEKVSDAAVAVGDDITDAAHAVKRDVGRAARDSRSAASSVAAKFTPALKRPFR